MFGEEGIYWL